jgi:hypothetical protein
MFWACFGTNNLETDLANRGIHSTLEEFQAWDKRPLVFKKVSFCFYALTRERLRSRSITTLEEFQAWDKRPLDLKKV